MSAYPNLQPGPSPPAYDGGGGYNPQNPSLAPPENTTYGQAAPTSPSASPQTAGPSYASYHDNPQQYQTYDKPGGHHGSIGSASTNPGYAAGGYTGGGYQGGGYQGGGYQSGGYHGGAYQSNGEGGYPQQQGPQQQAPMICPGVIPAMGGDGRIMSNDPEDTPGKVMCAQAGCLCSLCVPIVGPITFCFHMGAPPQSRRKKWAKYALITGLVMMTIGIISSIAVGSNRRRY